MNYLFIIQGEGRGHLSQAIAFKEKLEEQGDHLKAVYMGQSSYRKIPPYAETSLGIRPVPFKSPNFLRTKDRKGIKPIASVFFNLILTPLFIAEIFKLRKQIRKTDFDIVVNFYDMLGGLASWVSFSGKQKITVSHHYYLTSGNFTFPENFRLQKLLLRIHNRLCSLASTEIQGLSFVPGENNERLKIQPPLLRKKIRSLKTLNKGFVLVYLLNEGFLDEISNLAKKYTGTMFKVFCSDPNDKTKDSDNIELRALDENDFLSDLSTCSALITTAGFESQCEAAYLGKPVFTLPCKNHFEQLCNALDGQRAGVSKDLGEFNGIESLSQPDKTDFQKWCDSVIFL